MSARKSHRSVPASPGAAAHEGPHFDLSRSARQRPTEIIVRRVPAEPDAYRALVAFLATLLDRYDPR